MAIVGGDVEGVRAINADNRTFDGFAITLIVNATGDGAGVGGLGGKQAAEQGKAECDGGELAEESRAGGRSRGCSIQGGRAHFDFWMVTSFETELTGMLGARNCCVRGWRKTER